MSEQLAAIIISIVEGLTEYIPVSSTGHMIIVGNLIGFVGARADTFEIFIQMGAILSVVVLYFKDFLNLSTTILPSQRDETHKLSVVQIGVAILPILALGFILHGVIKRHLFGPQVVAIGLILGALLILFAEGRTLTAKKRDFTDLTLKDCLYIGLFQCLALWPGVSRSGATIIGGLLIGCERALATQFSFYLAVPVLGVAAVYDLYKNLSILRAEDISLFALGFVVAFFVALASLKILIGFVKRFTFKFFAYYRLGLAALVLWYFG